MLGVEATSQSPEAGSPSSSWYVEDSLISFQMKASICHTLPTE